MDLEYLKEFLDQVIVKVDFLIPVSSLMERIPPEFQAIIMDSFKIFEPNEITGQEVKINQNVQENSISSRQIKIKEWSYYTKDRKNKLTITSQAFFITYEKYDSFQKLHSEFMNILSWLFNNEQGIQIGRVGLRYINNITEKATNNLFSWPMLNQNLLSSFSILRKEEQKKLSRFFGLLEFNYDEFNLRFQYGMHNQDYPSVIFKKMFTLDFDAYAQGCFLREGDIRELLVKFHSAIKEMISHCGNTKKPRKTVRNSNEKK